MAFDWATWLMGQKELPEIDPLSGLLSPIDFRTAAKSVAATQQPVVPAQPVMPAQPTAVADPWRWESATDTLAQDNAANLSASQSTLPTFTSSGVNWYGFGNGEAPVDTSAFMTPSYADGQTSYSEDPLKLYDWLKSNDYDYVRGSGPDGSMGAGVKDAQGNWVVQPTQMSGDKDTAIMAAMMMAAPFVATALAAGEGAAGLTAGEAAAEGIGATYGGYGGLSAADAAQAAPNPVTNSVLADSAANTPGYGASSASGSVPGAVPVGGNSMGPAAVDAIDAMTNVGMDADTARTIAEGASTVGNVATGAASDFGSWIKANPSLAKAIVTLIGAGVGNQAGAGGGGTPAGATYSGAPQAWTSALSMGQGTPGAAQRLTMAPGAIKPYQTGLMMGAGRFLGGI